AEVDANDVIANAHILLERSTNTSLPEAERVSAKDAFYNIVSLLEGQRVEVVEAVAKRAVEQGALGLPAWKTRVFADSDGCGMTQIIRLLEERGIRVYFLSATPEVMVKEAARLMGLPASQAYGSVLGVRDGRYTGE